MNRRLRQALTFGFALWGGAGAAAAPPSAGPAMTYCKERSFGIPFHQVDPIEKQRLAEIQLYWSMDRGESWRQYGAARPDAGSFQFTAPQDGEYWFSVRSKDREGRLYPSSMERATPGLRVYVDTKAPELSANLMNPQGDLAGVRWQAFDDVLDERSLQVEYRPRGASGWQPVSTDPRPAGEASWRTGTNAPIDVRVRIRDKAGNESVKELSMGAPSGIQASPWQNASSPAPPQGAAGSMDAFQLPAQPPLDSTLTGQPSPPWNSAGVGAPPVQAFSQNPMGSPQPPQQQMLGQQTAPGQNPGANFPPPQATYTPPGPPGTMNPDAQARRRPAVDRPSTLNLRMVNSTRFNLVYSAEQVGKSGIGSVELWYTVDGRNWNCYGEDDDRESPFEVEVGGEGVYGFTMIAKSGAGVGDEPPQAGDPPQSWIEVDLTPPNVQVFPPTPGQGASAGILAIAWTAQDVNLAPRSIHLYYSEQADGPWKTIAENLENTGRYQWRTGKDVPYKFFVRVEAKDRAGNVGRADTLRPVYVDLSRPKLKITSVEPSRDSPPAPPE